MVESLNLFGELPEDTQQETAVVEKRENKITSQPAKKTTQKSAHAYRTISEVAKELDVAAHVLRFWESKFDDIKPLKRGGGRRYYRPEDVDTIRNIRDLLYDEGYTIRGVQAHLKKGPEDQEQPAVSTQHIGKKIINELKDIRTLLAS